MKTYMEVTWLLMFCIAYCSHVVACSLVFSVIPRKKIVLVSALYALCALVGVESLVGIILIELIQCILIYRRNIKCMLQMQLIRMFFVALAQWSISAYLKHWIIFIPKTSHQWIPYLMGIGIFHVVYQYILIPRIQRQRFEVEVQIELYGKTLKCLGLIDTGNSLHHQHLPVLFLSDKYDEYVNSFEGELIQYRSIQHQHWCKIHPCKIEIGGAKKLAFVSMSTQLNKPIDCLLNSRLFY